MENKKLRLVLNKFVAIMTVLALCVAVLLVFSGCSKKGRLPNTAASITQTDQYAGNNDYEKDEASISNSPEKLRFSNDKNGKLYAIFWMHYLQDSYDTYDLYRISYDLKSVEKIRDKVSDFIPSPSGEYILLQTDYVDLYHTKYYLEVINAKTKKVVYRASNTDYELKPNTVYFNGFSWMRGDSTIWFDVSKSGNDNTLYEYDLQAKEVKKVVNNLRGSIVSWSRDGRYLFYLQNPSEKKNVNLAVYDCKLKTSKVVAIEPQGKIKNAVFSQDGKTIFYSLNCLIETADVAKWTSVGQVKAVSVNGTSKYTLFSRRLDRKVSRVAMPDAENNISISKLMLSHDEKSLIFSVVDMADPMINNSIFRVDIDTKKETKILQPAANAWDYNPKTNCLLWYQASETQKGRILEKKLD